MIPARFAYAAPSSLAEAVALLADGAEGATLLGGGTWVVPELNRGERRPRLVVDLRRAGLSAIEDAGGRIRIGATCTYTQLLSSELVQRRLPLLHLMASEVTGGRQILNQGTLGGSVAAARPQSDAPAVVSALGGEAVVAGPRGERRCPPGALFAGPMRSALAPDEILAGFEFPAMRGAAYGYVKLKRGSSSWPIATAACVLDVVGDGTCRAAALVLGAVAPVPLRVELGEVLAGERLSEAALERAASTVGAALEHPWGDVLAPAQYRAAVAPVVARHALAAAWARWLAGGGA